MLHCLVGAILVLALPVAALRTNTHFTSASKHSAISSDSKCCEQVAPGGYYKPSTFELNENPATRKKGCDQALQPSVETWLSEIKHRSMNDTSVFSRLCVPGHCAEQLLEPLAFTLLDPRLECPDFAKSRWGAKYESKNSMLPQLSKQHLAIPSDPNIVGQGKALLFDLGASWYGGGNPVPGEKDGWGSSGKWFVEEYNKRGINFDHLYLWEANNDEETYRAAGLPANLSDRITFFHTEVQSDGPGPENPFNILKEKCNVNDYCVLKLDIDEPDVENRIVDHLLKNDDGMRDRVDEFFWDPIDQEPETAFYLKLRHLRELGVRAHSWV